MNVTVRGRKRHYRTVAFDEKSNEVLLIEQRLLPHEFKVVRIKNYRATARAITDMIVRGAGAIGATAAYGFAQGLNAFRGKDLAKFQVHVDRVFKTLADARPTAVDPMNAMKDLIRQINAGESVLEKQEIALLGAHAFADEDANHCRAIGRHGAKLIRNGTRVLTHCNAGWLAFVDFGSATAPMYAAQEKGRKFHVFCDETRPRAQGASLTAWELAQQGISHEVIADNAAGHLMQRGEIDLVIVGSDRTLGRTGEVANKIGTYTKAVLAHRHKIPFYVAIPESTIDWELKRGIDIPIEDRHESEVLGAWGKTSGGRREYVRIANHASGARNPGFDVTPPELITGIITPSGIFKPRELWRNRAKLQSATD
ncbi:MAG: S-methyl-5-thioribose-1-phosphate isomerase [Verrucomicrobiales bacterium]|nr:S-methyl-5-thioribose-1-phosphate isomerase [Verrucomicrobiales bacterium]|tara:strand:- start:639 stop:1745 length:1107 start_codon:yes stop_codon:yes gene_type:complete